MQRSQATGSVYGAIWDVVLEMWPDWSLVLENWKNGFYYKMKHVLFIFMYNIVYV